MVDPNSLKKSQVFLLKINGVDLSSHISSFSIDEYDITSSDTGMNGDGKTIIDYVALDKIKVNLKWSSCSSAYINTIKNAISSGTFECEYVDADNEEKVTIQAYRGDRKRTMITNDQGVITWDFEFNVISLEGTK